MSTSLINFVKENYESVFAHITPIGKPRQTYSDKWWKTGLKSKSAKVRERAEKIRDYYAKVDAIRWLLKNVPKGDEVIIEAVMPMPPSWPLAKRKKMMGQPHQSKPDADNILKWVVDALYKEDSQIHTKMVWKTWGDEGGIRFYFRR